MKYICTDCGYITYSNNWRTAPNPFEPGETILGCPNCSGVDTATGVCDEPECREPATCGTPTPAGYRHTCGKHCTREEKP